MRLNDLSAKERSELKYDLQQLKTIVAQLKADTQEARSGALESREATLNFQRQALKYKFIAHTVQAMLPVSDTALEQNWQQAFKASHSEVVSASLSSNKGRDLEVLLNQMAKLKMPAWHQHQLDVQENHYSDPFQIR